MERGANVWMRSAARSEGDADLLRQGRPSSTRSGTAPSADQDGPPHGDPPGSDAGSMRTAKSTAVDMDLMDISQGDEPSDVEGENWYLDQEPNAPADTTDIGQDQDKDRRIKNRSKHIATF